MKKLLPAVLAAAGGTLLALSPLSTGMQLGIAAVIGLMLIAPLSASAHCDTMDGPAVKDGLKALETGNVNYALKWIQPDDEKEISEAFTLAMKVKDLNPDAKEIAEKYFLDNLIRVHRAGEGAPFTGVKPHGAAIDDKVAAADKSLEIGDLSLLEPLMEKEKLPELRERFAKVMALKGFDVDDVEAGRNYIEAYVKYFKFAEGEEDEHHHHGHQ